jgi:hypothetical protein
LPLDRILQFRSFTVERRSNAQHEPQRCRVVEHLTGDVGEGGRHRLGIVGSLCVFHDGAVAQRRRFVVADDGSVDDLLED